MRQETEIWTWNSHLKIVLKSLTTFNTVVMKVGQFKKHCCKWERLVYGGGKCVDRFPNDFLLPTEERLDVVLGHSGR